MSKYYHQDLSRLNTAADEEIIRLALLKVPAPIEVMEMQQTKNKPKYLSASAKQRGENPHLNHHCERCNSNSHMVAECPWSNANLLAPTG